MSRFDARLRLPSRFGALVPALALLLAASVAQAQVTYQWESLPPATGTNQTFNNSQGSETEDNWVANAFRVVAGGTRLNSISIIFGNHVLTNQPVTVTIYNGSSLLDPSGLTRIVSSTNTVSVSVNAIDQLVNIPLANPVDLSVGQIFYAAALMPGVPGTWGVWSSDGNESPPVSPLGHSFFDVGPTQGAAYNLDNTFNATVLGATHPVVGVAQSPGNLGLRVLASSVPEPSSLALLLVAGSAGMGISIRLRRRSAGPRRAVLLVVLTVAITAPPAEGRQILVVANQLGSVGEYDATTGAAINASFISTPTGHSLSLARDANNHLFVGQIGTNPVGEYNATTGAMINANFITAVNNPYALVLDGNNHIFSANTGAGVAQYDAATGAAINTTFVDLQGAQPRGLVLDGNNHLFVTVGRFDTGGNNSYSGVAEFDATTGATINFGFIVEPPGTQASGIALNATLNRLLVANQLTQTVSEYDAATGATINTAFINNGQGLSSPFALAFDDSNHLFVGNFGNFVGEYDATTGATINSAFIFGPGIHQPDYLLFVASVPEPSSLLLIAAAAGIALARRKKCNAAFNVKVN
jgi:hypothetical protein